MKHIRFIFLLESFIPTKYPKKIGQRADILQKAMVNVWDNEKCQKSFDDQTKGHIITATQLCAGYMNGGIDSCWVYLT